MVIKASSGETVDRLLSDLASGEETRRDAAVARLTIIGPRAAQRVLTLAANPAATTEARVAAFRVLDAMGEARALDIALVAIGDPSPAIAASATGVARAFLHSERGLAALDRLSETALDSTRPADVRAAAAHALAALGSPSVQPLLDRLRDDAEPAVVAAAAGAPPAPAPSRFASARALVDAATALPDTPAPLREQIALCGGTVPVTVLHQLVEQVRIREGGEAGDVRAGWTAARAAAHAALAQRGSRLALYDLRETMESARGPVAVEFLTALHAIGDATCLEPVAAAYAAVGDAGRGDWWHRGLGDVFRAIVQREALTRRHATVRKIEKRFPGLFDALTAPIRM